MRVQLSEIFESFAGVFVRSAYRSMLGRDPEEGVSYATYDSPLNADDEMRLEEILRQMISSDEFLGRIPHKREFKPETWVLATICGDLKIWLDLGDMGVSRPALREDYEPAETAFVDSILQPGMHFADIGANIGWFALRAARAVGPAGKVTAFEPRVRTAQHLAMSAVANGFDDRMVVHQMALGAKEGELHIGYGADGWNAGGTWTLTSPELLKQYMDAGHMVQATPVKRFDDVIGTDHVDIIKIDIEGAEMLALSGAIKVIGRTKPIILTEINPGAIRKVSHTEPDDLVNMIRNLGYNGFYLENGGIGSDIGKYIELPAGSDMTNVVFLPKN